MKRYIVKFSENVCLKYIGDRFNKETKKWEYDVPCEEWDTEFEFSSLKSAKKLINENLEKYVSSCIYKFWSNGDFENLGEIKVKGNNRTFVANTRQKKAGY